MRGRETERVHLASRGAFMPFTQPTQSYYDILRHLDSIEMAGAGRVWLVREDGMPTLDPSVASRTGMAPSSRR